MSMEKVFMEIKELKQLLAESLNYKKEMLTIDEASVYLGIAKSTLYKMNLTRQIPFFKPSPKAIYYKRTDLDAWMKCESTHDQNKAFQVNPRKRRVASK